MRERQFGTLMLVHNPLPMLIWPNARPKGGSSSG